MVAGTLTNNTTLNLGPSDHSLAANTTVTAAGLANTGTVNLFGNTGSPAIRATVTVNGPATNSGTVNLPTATSLTVSRDGQRLCADGPHQFERRRARRAGCQHHWRQNVRKGMVTGAANIGGTGTIEVIDLANNSLPTALVINGNYSQSGGTFDALLHGTGIQIDEVNVTNGHSVNLTGGDIEVSGVTFTAGQVFEDIIDLPARRAFSVAATVPASISATAPPSRRSTTTRAGTSRSRSSLQFPYQLP